MQPVLLTIHEFLDKLAKPEGFIVLIEDYTVGRYEMHVYRSRDMVICYSPNVYKMPQELQISFSEAVESAALHPPGDVKRFQW